MNEMDKPPLIQFRDDTTCAFPPTGADGAAALSVAGERIHGAHALHPPEGYRQDTVEYKTMVAFSDVTIIPERE